MATSTKKSSKASAKTISKAKTTATSSSKAKVVAKKPTEKVSNLAKVSPKSTSVSKKDTPIDKLKSLLRFSSLMHLVLIAISVFALKSDVSTEWLWNSQARDVFAAGDKVDLGPASEVIVTVQNRYVLAAVLGVSLVMTLLLLTKYWNRYSSSLKSPVSGFRWLVLGISSALMVEFASMLAGVQDIFTLKLIGVLVLSGVLFAWFAERENKLSGSSHKLGIYASGFAYALALLPLLASLVGTSVFSQERFAWFVYVVAVLVVFQLVYTHRKLRMALSKTSKLEYSVYEYHYFMADLLIKALIVLTLIFGYLKIQFS